jgi:translation elongation factor EF-Tu-like GTPase
MKYKAKVKFLTSDEGGRRRPPMSGYKPHLKIGDEYTSCWIYCKNTGNEVMELGTEHDVELELQFEDNYQSCFFLKESIELYEGSKLVGTGKFCSEF